MLDTLNKTITTDQDIIEFRREILKWYDSHKRVLPWRTLSGHKNDPYKVWLSEIMLQQTTVQAVIPYFLKFIKKWPTIEALANENTQNVMNAWAGLGYYARARNLHKCAKVVTKQYNGIFPKEQTELKTLPGIGDYTSAAITSIAYGQPATVVDGNIERIMARYFAVQAPLPASKKELKALAHIFSNGQTERPGDYAQALMDLGATICTPKSPSCELCPIKIGCRAHQEGLEEKLPLKIKKNIKPKKIGYVYRIRNMNGDLLLHTRPENGLLGGMIGLPTSDWILEKKYKDLKHIDNIKILNNTLTNINKTIQHSFTHFDLDLHLYEMTYTKSLSLPDRYFWCRNEEINNLFLPTVFKKAYDIYYS